MMIAKFARPYISSTGLSCTTTTGSNVVGSAAQFGSVTVGMPMKGVGFPPGTEVTAVTSPSVIEVSDVATATGSPTLQFGYNGAPPAVAAGDVVGFSFPWSFEVSDVNGLLLESVQKFSITPEAHVNMTLWLFSDRDYTEALDNAAMALVAANFNRSLIGVVPLSTANGYGVGGANGEHAYCHISRVNIPIPRLHNTTNAEGEQRFRIYGLLTATAAYTPLSIQNLVIKAIFRKHS